MIKKGKKTRYACHLRGDDERAHPQVYTYLLRRSSVNAVAFVARLVSALADVTNGSERDDSRDEDGAARLPAGWKM